VSLAQQIDADLTDALRARDRTRLATLRLLKAAAKNAEVEKRAPLDDSEYQNVIRRQVKQRREAASEYERAGRHESAEQERAEQQILESYLPTQLDDASIRRAIESAIQESGATGPADMGKVMSRVMPSLRGRADGSRVNQLARELLSSRSSV
jgi:uncharacterized protein YqeY